MIITTVFETDIRNRFWKDSADFVMFNSLSLEKSFANSIHQKFYYSKPWFHRILSNFVIYKHLSISLQNDESNFLKT